MDPTKEPSADHRAGAQYLFSMFNALMLEGFTEAQALAILGYTLTAAINRGQADG